MRMRRMKGRLGSTAKGVMNRTEAKFAERLRSLQLDGKVIAWHYEAVKVCVVPGETGKRQAVFYTPDFMVLHADGEVEMIDVKGAGGWEDTARVKIKAAAERFPMFAWSGYTLTKTGWEREAFN